MTVRIDGRSISSEADFHRAVADVLGFGQFYGHNLDALRDRLSADVERPIELVWSDSQTSKAQMGSKAFDAICGVLRGVERYDQDAKLEDRFRFILE